jgi:hypothetical protein
MGGRRAALLQCGIDEATDRASTAGDGAGDLRRDRVTEGSRCGRLWKPLSGFQAAVDGAFPSTAAAASTPRELREDVRELHHLTGHYPSMPPAIAPDLHTVRLKNSVYPEFIELPDLLTSLFNGG